MSEALFTVDHDTPAENAPLARVTEADMLALLRQRYTKVSMNAHRYAYAEHVADQPGFAARIADFIAVDCYGFGGYGPGRQYAIHGHEVKVSRSDWLAELRTPAKAEAFRPYCHYWWLVVASHDIVKPSELPVGWGLMGKVGGQLRSIRRAMLTTPEPMPPPMLASLLRATAKTARRTGVPDSSSPTEQEQTP